ncbi:hypothetical protein AAW12_18640 [Sphingobacterium sp. Ag1]|uniref:SMI1/KNR4 family protein n=1 Tax=Sphingobacterium sp. Ag1 TaxID=1643451 RepID=UPI0006280AE6|nr:SMI1/KNR4 family protein [Sphingobacterium sp. Ag1]KKO89644.1 hypothetical protein AAW12_18640 [Sphingobacterium sp. Ag1]
MLLELLQNKWKREGIKTFIPVRNNELISFQKTNNIVLPPDLIKYFNVLNGTGSEYTDTLYEFYALNKVKTINEEFENWKGIPNYRELLNIISSPGELYVFANYQFNLYVYAIRLYTELKKENEVYVFCGGDYKIIGNTFSKFLEEYINDSDLIRI